MDFDETFKFKCPACGSDFYHTIDTHQDGFIFNNLTCSLNKEHYFFRNQKEGVMEITYVTVNDKKYQFLKFSRGTKYLYKIYFKQDKIYKSNLIDRNIFDASKLSFNKIEQFIRTCLVFP